MTKHRRDQKVIVTAGATREYIDPVRFISNPSTGKMGLELAKELFQRGFSVILVRTVSSTSSVPEGIILREVETSEEMAREVLDLVKDCDCLIMAAAVGDLTPVKTARKKLKKGELASLPLKQTTDILSQARGKRGLIKIGFALETDRLERNAREKLQRKGLSLIVANLAGEGKNPFGSGKKDYFLIPADGGPVRLQSVTKKRLAREVAERVEVLLGK